MFHSFIPPFVHLEVLKQTVVQLDLPVDMLRKVRVLILDMIHQLFENLGVTSPGKLKDSLNGPIKYLIRPVFSMNPFNFLPTLVNVVMLTQPRSLEPHTFAQLVQVIPVFYGADPIRITPLVPFLRPLVPDSLQQLILFPTLLPGQQLRHSFNQLQKLCLGDLNDGSQQISIDSP